MQESSESALKASIDRLAENVRLLGERLDRLSLGAAAAPAPDAPVTPAARRFQHLLRGLELRPPVVLQTNARSKDAVELRWSLEDRETAERKLWRCEGSGCQNFSQIRAPGPEERSHVDEGLKPNTTYRYKLTVR
ncbi:MAG TPA: fibronectin type III domain-containing protein, partial [Myxococcota bacterium]|nr:fibronectin type III domain-containing protein [Myxococcota bacterium]